MNHKHRFTIRWVEFGTEQSAGYRVSIPNFDGGEVVLAEDYDGLAQQHRKAVDTLRKAAERAMAERDGADSYAILRDAVWEFIDSSVT